MSAVSQATDVLLEISDKVTIKNISDWWIKYKDVIWALYTEELPEWASAVICKQGKQLYIVFMETKGEITTLKQQLVAGKISNIFKEYNGIWTCKFKEPEIEQVMLHQLLKNNLTTNVLNIGSIRFSSDDELLLDKIKGIVEKQKDFISS